jgi:hypothetical protein
MRRLWCVALLAASAGSAPAQDIVPGGVRGPVLGYMWDEASRGLRPLLGIPGASRLAGPIRLEPAVSYAEGLPGQDYALGVDAGSGEVLLIDLRGGGRAQPVAGAGAAPDRILFGPTGATAALYFRERRTVQLLSGLPGAASVVAAIDIGALPGVLTSLAVNDNADLLLAAVSEGDAGSLFALTVEAGPRRLAAIGRASALVFLENSQDALLADESRREVLLLRDASAAAEIRVLAGERDGLSRPVAVAATAGRLLAADAGGQAVALLDPAGGAPAMLSCDCRVSGLYRLRGDVFRLTAVSEAPQFLLETGAEPRVLFAPVDRDQGPETPPAPERIFRTRSR